MKFTFNPFAVWLMRPSTHDILARQLVEAEASRAEHATAAEYHAAMRKMLDARIERLRSEIGGGA